MQTNPNTRPIEGFESIHFAGFTLDVVGCTLTAANGQDVPLRRAVRGFDWPDWRRPATGVPYVMSPEWWPWSACGHLSNLVLRSVKLPPADCADSQPPMALYISAKEPNRRCLADYRLTETPRAQVAVEFSCTTARNGSGHVIPARPRRSVWEM